MSQNNPTTDLPLFAEGSTAEAAGLSHARGVPPRANTSRERTGQPAPFVAGNASSEAAARKIEPSRKSKREQVYLFILSRGANGATRKEIALATGMSENTVRPRVVELQQETDSTFGCGRVVESWGPSTLTRDGCKVLYAGVFAYRECQRATAA